MKLKGVFNATLAGALCAGVLAGCGGSGDKSGATAAPSAPANTASASASPSNAPVTLKWALWDWEATAYYKPLIEAYKKTHPNVTIEYVDLGSTDYMTMLSTQLSGGADLDILTIKDIPGYANLVKQNHLEPLKSYISKAGIDTGACRQLFTGI